MARGYFERVVLGEERGALSWVIRVLLWPLSLVYRLGLMAYLFLYVIGLRKRHRLPAVVISVGNLTFGGTGKTPAVQTICRMLQAMGKRAAVLSRGHGGSASGSVVVSDGESVLSDAAQCGDEPVLLAKTLPGVPVLVGKDRRRSGELACRRFRPDAVILDDGLQYWQLHRDLDIAVVDAARPFGSGMLMPMGDLREPVSGLKRAGVVLINGMEPSSAADNVARLAQDALVVRAVAVPVSLYVAADGTDVGPAWIAGKKVVAFCGIGRPGSFLDILQRLGACVEAFVEFPDHHGYTKEELDALREKSTLCGAEATVTTEKDWARLGYTAPVPNLYVLSISLEIEESARLAEHIANTIDRASKATAAYQAAD